MTKPYLFLVDATAFCYRAFYALHNLSTSFGQPTNAIYGFVNMLHKILKERKPQYLAVCFDVSRETFRQKKFAAYKIQRPAMPEGLISQIPLIKQIIAAYGITILEKEGFEADDLIATTATRAKKQGFSAVVISADKDMLQLVGEDITVFSPYKDSGTTYDLKKVRERYGVEPEKIPEIIALMGDSVDNIPGVPGIGEKTAVELLKKFGSLDNLLKNLDRLEPQRIAESVGQNQEKIKLSKDLAKLHTDVDIDFKLEELKIRKPNLNDLSRLFRYLEFKRFLKDLPQEEQDPEEKIKVNKISDKELGEVLKEIDEVVLYGNNFSDLTFFVKEQIYGLEKIGANTKDLFADSRIKKISHDLKRIKLLLAEEGINLAGLSFDTMIASYLLNPSRSSYALSDIAFDYLGKNFGAGPLVSAEAVALLQKLKAILEKELEEKALRRLFWDLEMPLVEVLTEMEQNGIKLDLAVLKRLSADLEKRLGKLIEEIYELSSSEFNINSPKQLREILFVRLKLPVVKRSKTGPSTDEEVLRKLSQNHKLPQFLLEYRQLMKLKTTYVDTLPGLVNPKTKKIHTSFNQVGTETGRLSSANPNLQNIPIKTEIGSQIRKAIIAQENQDFLLSGDYSQIELRILAHLSHDENLLSAFKKGKDIHQATASLIYGSKENAVSEMMRETAKRVNFGIIYGLSAYGLSRDLGINLEAATGFIESYFLRYPGVKRYIEEQIQKARQEGFVTTILGRRRYLPEINNKNQAIRQFAERQAVNTPIQGSASDLIKLAMLSLHRQIKERKLKTRMVLQIHDELLFDAPESELPEIVPLVRERMENVLKLDVPLKVEIKKGKNWLEMTEIKEGRG